MFIYKLKSWMSNIYTFIIVQLTIAEKGTVCHKWVYHKNDFMERRNSLNSMEKGGTNKSNTF